MSSTQIVPSLHFGIPKCNALLTTHLGNRREYLLGIPNALALLQQTGGITRSKRQYVVYNLSLTTVHIVLTKQVCIANLSAQYQ